MRARARACSNTTERRDTIEGSDERGGGGETNGASQSAGPLADRSAGRNARCVFMCARGPMIRVYHSRGV